MKTPVDLYLIYVTTLKYDIPPSEIVKKWKNKAGFADYSNAARYPGTYNSDRRMLIEHFNALMARTGIMHPAMAELYIDYKNIVSFLIIMAGSKFRVSAWERLRARMSYKSNLLCRQGIDKFFNTVESICERLGILE